MEFVAEPYVDSDKGSIYWGMRSKTTGLPSGLARHINTDSDCYIQEGFVNHADWWQGFRRKIQGGQTRIEFKPNQSGWIYFEFDNSFDEFFRLDPRNYLDNLKPDNFKK
jgi:hypothetical protein